MMNAYNNDRRQGLGSRAVGGSKKNRGLHSSHKKRGDKKFNGGKDDREHSSVEYAKTKVQKALDGNNTTKEIIKMAEGVVSKTGAKTSQIRRIYGPVVKIQAQLPPTEDKGSNKWERELSMLKPRVVYAAARKHKKLEELKHHIMAFIDMIEEKPSGSKEKREWTQYFCHFIEAVVAYHKQEESKKSG